MKKCHDLTVLGIHARLLYGLNTATASVLYALPALFKLERASLRGMAACPAKFTQTQEEPHNEVATSETDR